MTLWLVTVTLTKIGWVRVPVMAKASQIQLFLSLMTGSLAAACFCGDGDLDFFPQVLLFPGISVVVMMVKDVCEHPEFDRDRSNVGLADSLPPDRAPFPVSPIPVPLVISDLAL